MKALRALFGGSFGPVQAILLFSLLGFIGYHWTRYHNAIEDREALTQDLEKERTRLFWAEFERRFAVQQMGAIVELQAKQEENQAYQGQTERIIYAQPKTNDCASAPAIRVSLGRMRDQRAADTAGAEGHPIEREPVQD